MNICPIFPAFRTSCLFLGALLLASARLPAADVADDLLPRPQEIQVREGWFTALPETWRVQISAENPTAGQRLARQWSEILSEPPLSLSHPPKVRTQTTKAGAGWRLCVATSSSHLKRLAKAGLPDWNPEPARAEGYQILIAADGIRLGAASEQGLFYGLQTLGQLLGRQAVRQDPGLPCLTIHDWPGLAMRGYSEDFGRNQLPTIEDHKRTIRLLARHKLNTHLWFIESDHFQYAFDPTLGANADRFRFDEIRELVAYAGQYHIEVIPTVELLGHMENTLAHPAYRRLAEVPGLPDLCATSDEAFDLARKMVGEIAPAFASPYFHCGLDESFQIGKGQSAEAVKARGLERVMADYYIRMNNLVRSRGKTLMMYADIVLAHPGIIEMLPKDIVMMFWDYTPRESYAQLDKLHQAGFRVVSLSGFWDWASFYPAYSLGFRNIQTLARQSHDLKLPGHCVSSWGDQVLGAQGMNLSELNDYGLGYSAALSWKPDNLKLADYSKAFARDYFGSADERLPRALTLLAESQGDRVTQVRRLFEDSPANGVKVMANATVEDLAFWRQLKQASEEAVQLLQPLAESRPGKQLRNQDRLPSILLAARLNLLGADRALALRDLGTSAAAGTLDQAGRAAVFEALAERLESLGTEYRKLYLATNRPINMTAIGNDWARMVRQTRELAAQLKAGQWKG